MLTYKGATILDIFSGTGTTGVAAVSNGRNYIGIEKEIKYQQIALQRIKGTKSKEIR